MQVHPLVAVRWMRRLRDLVVIAANDGYRPGRVNSAMRTTADVNLVDLLRGLPLAASRASSASAIRRPAAEAWRRQTLAGC